MKVKFITLGCKVNQYETQALLEDLEREGFVPTEGIADLYVINTCSVTHRADAKSREAIVRAKKENPSAKIAAIGCLVNTDYEKLKSLGVDYLLPQDKKYYLKEILLGRDFNSSKDVWSMKISKFFNHRAFVKVQDGCDNFCSFCKIPYLRGKPISRPKNDILEEIKRLSVIYPEIVICGVNLSLYGKEHGFRETLTSLIEEILKIDSLKRLRLSSIEPAYINRDFLRIFKHKKICPHLHLPFQSGDDKILKLMNKKENVSFYKKIVDWIREVNPLIAISCDIIVGFPYENEESFLNTVEFLKEIEPMRMHIFSFSARQFTPFQNIQVKNTKVVKERYSILKDLAEKFACEYKKKFLGKKLSMVTEKREGKFVSGYTENYIRVKVEDEKKAIPLGRIIDVKIEKIIGDEVIGNICFDD